MYMRDEFFFVFADELSAAVNSGMGIIQYSFGT